MIICMFEKGKECCRKNGLVGNRTAAGRRGRKPWQWSGRNDSGVAEDGDDEEDKNGILYSIQLVGAHLAPSLPGLGPNPWSCSPPQPKSTVRVAQVWVLIGPCFPQPTLWWSLAPKEVFFSSEWVRRMMKPSLICSCTCLLRRALWGWGVALCLSCLCSVQALTGEELENYCSWSSLPPPHPKQMKGMLGLSSFTKRHISVFAIEREYI